MASLRKRGSQYYASYYVGGRELRKSLDTNSYQVAKDRLRNLERALSTGALDDVLPTRTPVREIVCEYAAHIRSTKTRNGWKTDFFYLRNSFGPICELFAPKDFSSWKKRKRTFLRAKHLEEIRTADIGRFIAQKVNEDGIAPKTANRYREVIMRLFNWSMKQRGVRLPGGRNPVNDVERYLVRAPEITFLNRQEIAVQLGTLEDDRQLQCMVALYIFAGLRREEALWLTRDDIDLKAGRFGTIRVRAKTVLGEFWEPKTKSNRAVPVSRALRGYLDGYLPPSVRGCWFFPSPQGKRWDPDNFSSRLKRANDCAGLPWSCQEYRHTFGSQLAMKGESLYKIATLMGNSPEICRRHYAALLPESLENSVEFYLESSRQKTNQDPVLRVIARRGRMLNENGDASSEGRDRITP